VSCRLSTIPTAATAALWHELDSKPICCRFCTKKSSASASTAQQQASASHAEADNLRDVLASYQGRETDAGTLINLSGLMFATGSAELRPGAEQRLQPLSRYLSRAGAQRVRIEGHTDNVGSASANLALSKARADAVADYISSQGVDRTLFETRGLGEGKPVASNRTSSGREENRRVEVTILR
jgi:outer membrane protein OmpA-like peptidoglycan-associated protein